MLFTFCTVPAAKQSGFLKFTLFRQRFNVNFSFFIVFFDGLYKIKTMELFMKNSLLKKTGLFCLSFFLFTCTTLPKEVAPLVYNGGRQNVILMIGDGMGLNHIKAAQAVYGDLFITTAEKAAEGEVTTYSLNVLPTDSAAAATALATGNKTRNGQIGQLNGEAFESTTERALCSSA